MGEKAEATPGPWHAFIRSDTNTFAVFGPENDPRKPVVKWVGLDATVTEFGAKKVEANTHMLAASRDMYEALEALCSDYAEWEADPMGGGKDIHALYAQAFAAIAKARGEGND